jgi:hypothetical protein
MKSIFKAVRALAPLVGLACAGLAWADDSVATTQSTAAFTLGFLGQGSAKGEHSVWRANIQPTLHFDGSRWYPAGNALDLQSGDPEPLRDEAVTSLPYRYHPMPDAALADIERRAKVAAGSWKTWRTLFVDGKNIGATSAWQMHSRCQPGYVLGVSMDAKRGQYWINYKARNEHLATTPLNAAKFVETTLSVDDPLRKLAIAEWYRGEETLLRSSKFEGVSPQNVSKIPNTVKALRSFKLNWLPAQCATLGEDRLCQLDARRRFDGKDSTDHDLEPVGYTVLVHLKPNLAPRVLHSHVSWLPIWESFGGVPSEPDFLIALFEVEGQRWVYRQEPLMEGVSYCVAPVINRRQSSRHGDVCVTWSC